MIEEPKCNKAPAHDWQLLGAEDNGEIVHRCGSCLTRRYVMEDWEQRLLELVVLRYEAAQ